MPPPLTLLRWFDEALLVQLFPQWSEAERQTLLRHPAVLSVNHPSTRWHVDVTRITISQTLDEWYADLYKVFLDRLRERYDPDDEDEAFYHLEQLYRSLYMRADWAQILELCRVASEVTVRRVYRLRLQLYKGVVLSHGEEPNYEIALELLLPLRQDPEADTYTQVRATNGVALIYFYQTQYDLALEAFNTLRVFARKVNDHMFEAVAANNLGMVYNDLGDYTRALKQSQQARTIYRRLKLPDREAGALYECGNNALRLGHWRVAERWFAKAASLAQPLHSSRLKNIYYGQGLLYHCLGDTTRSEAAYRKALMLTPPNERMEADIRWALGVLYQTQRRFDEAHTEYLRAFVLTTQQRRPHYSTLISYSLGMLFYEQGAILEAYKTYAKAIKCLEHLRGNTHLETAKLGLLGTTTFLYEAMVTLLLALGKNRRAFHYMERARAQAFLDQLQTKYKREVLTTEGKTATLSEVQRRLPDGVVLLEYFTIGVLPQGDSIVRHLPPQSERLRTHLLAETQVWCFVITRTSHNVIKLNPQVPFDFLPPRISNTESPLNQTVLHPMRHLLGERIIVDLYNDYLAPVAPYVSGSSHILIAPHGPLHFVPWMALRSSDGQYLIRRKGPAISFAPSSTILVRHCWQAHEEQEGDFLGLGYNGTGKNALRYAEWEADHLSRLMKGDAQVGKQAKIKRLKRISGSLRALHISGHGHFNPRNPLGSCFVIGARERLSAREVMQVLQLRTQVVTISTCRSGLNRIMPGDEPLGFIRAFLYAGATTVVCSQWDVYDVVSLLVMERFYNYLRHGVTPAPALREAVVKTRTMTGKQFAKILECWRHTGKMERELFHEIRVPLETYEHSVFQSPALWAFFMVVGKP